MISVSVIVPVYNVSRYIERCLYSVLNQTYAGPIECLVVDDCGQDDSMEKVRHIVDAYNGPVRLKVLSHERNMGLSEARNTALRAATGDYVFFLDSDDELSIYALQLMTEKIDKCPGVDMVIGGFYLPSCYDFAIRYNKSDVITGLENCKKALLKPELLPDFAHNKLIRRDVIVDNGLFFESGLLHEDNLWKWNLSKHIRSIALVKGGTYIYFKNPGSILTGKNLKKYEDRLIIGQKKIGAIDPVCENEQIRHIIDFLLNLDSDIRYAYKGEELNHRMSRLHDMVKHLHKRAGLAGDIRSWVSLTLFRLELKLRLSVDNMLFWYIHRGSKMFAVWPKP